MSWLDDAVVETAEEKLQKQQEATINSLTSVVQKHLDEKAQERNYDNMLSLCTYATSVNSKFSAEGQAGVEWRDSVWSLGYEIMNDVLAGNRPVPTEQELIAEMPEFNWPNI